MPEILSTDFAARWFDYWRRSSGSRDERKALELGEPADVVATHNWVADKMEAGGRSAVEVLAVLAEAARDDDEVMTVAVGPVENLLYAHGDRIVDMLLDHARRSSALAQALAHVSLNDGSISPSSLTKLALFGNH